MVKMTKVAIKILYAVIIFTILVALVTPVFAADNPEAFSKSIQSTTRFDSVLGKVMGGVQAVGIGVAVIILAVVGIKYIMGSAEEKAEYKKVMIPYVIGAALIGGAPVIANMIYTFGKELTA